MNSDDLETHVRNINDRTTRIEQILPTLATKDDVREEGERTRRHFDVVAEQMKTEIALIAAGHDATKEHVNAQLREVKKELTAHDRRIMKLEAGSMKRR